MLKSTLHTLACLLRLFRQENSLKKSLALASFKIFCFGLGFLQEGQVSTFRIQFAKQTVQQTVLQHSNTRGSSSYNLKIKIYKQFHLLSSLIITWNF